MNNYFASQNIEWTNFSPDSIIFKRNALTKKLLPPQNLMSWKTKRERDDLLAKETGGVAIKGYGGYYSTNNCKGVMVRLNDLKTDYPWASVDFIDLTERRDSVGNNLGSLYLLTHIISRHQSYEWKRVNGGDWARIAVGNACPLGEGYRFSYAGQGANHDLSHREFLEVVSILEAIRKFWLRK